MKPVLFACVLSFASALAQSAESSTAVLTRRWDFSYTGFYDQEAAAFLPGLRLDGSFSGIDANADGAIERGELTSLRIGAQDYVACAAASNAYYHCGADAFLFSAARGLSFSLGEYGSDPEGLVGAGHVITTGELDYEYRFTPYSSSEHHLYWTDATLLSVVATVPEAPAWAMLLAGLGGIQWWRRRGRG